MSIARAIVGGGDSDPRRDLHRMLRDRYGSADVVLFDSGTSALAAAIRATGGPVAIPAFACFDVATACDAAGVVPILYDVRPETLSPDVQSVAGALAAGARAVVAVHHYGIPVDVARLEVLARASGADVIEDAAQATGALLGGGRRAGSAGSFGVLSFGRGKGVTGGGGGALLLRDAAAAARHAARGERMAESPGIRAAQVAATVAQWILARPSLYELPTRLPFLRLGETVYRSAHEPGPMTRFSASLVTELLAGEDGEAATRRNAARWFEERLASAPHTLVRSEVADAIPGWLRFPVRLPAAAHDLIVRGDGLARLGIMPSYNVSLADLPGFRERVANPAGPFDGARWLARHLVTAPTHSLLGDSERRRLADALVTLGQGEPD